MPAPTPPLRWLVSCDESGIHGSRFYGFGSLWMPYQRRGEFLELVRSIRTKHRYRDEFKWSNVGPGSVSAYVELADLFFRTPWLAFHAVICSTSMVRRELHDSKTQMYQKHFTMLLTAKIKQCRERHQRRSQTFRVWVDPLPTGYAKASEVVEKIANAVLKPSFGKVRPVDGVTVMDSKDTPSIQMCDVLLGAAISAWQDKIRAIDKKTVQAAIAERLGWDHLRSDTARSERKFNIWMFHDPSRGERVAVTKPVTLRYPLPGPRR